MPRQTKAKTTEVTETVAPVAVAAVEQPPAVQKVKKEKAVKKEKETVVEVAASVVITPVVAAPTTVIETVDEPVAELDSSLLDKSVDFVSKLQQLSSLMSSLKTEYKVLEKQWTRELKVAQKQSSKKKRKAGNRAPSGFVKPTRISDELAKFLEKPVGSEMARTEVTRDINTYIRTNNLQDKVNGRKIIPDTKLSALLKIQKGDELTYFNLQRYMSPHFSKASKPLTATATA
jgi:chromatin remodeling complex protein RSC6